MEKGQFFLGSVSGQGYFAITNVNASFNTPHFCVHGNTESETVEEAFRALQAYLDHENRTCTLRFREAQRMPFKSVEQFFVPQEVIFAQAEKY